MTRAVLAQLTTWTTEDDSSLTQLAERLNTQDPLALAHKKRNAKAQIDQIVGHLNAIALALDKQQISMIHALSNEATDKRRVVTESARVTSANLEGIGSATWQALWKSARAFSQIVYPGREFPVTDDARCLLCHQKLDVIAQQRLKDFETFVQGDLEAAAVISEQRYQMALKQLPVVWNQDDLLTRFQAADLTDQTLLSHIVTYCTQASTIREAILRGETVEQATSVNKPVSLLADLQARSAVLEVEATQHDLDATGFNRIQASKDKLNLEARRWTAQQSAAIQTEVMRLQQIAKYEEWKRLANSKAISTKASVITEAAITEAFVNRFNTELQKLGARQLQVELVKTRTTKATALHRIRLKGAEGQVLPQDVLSDGERRIIALAAFIADVVEKPYTAPFVFDDPISSLDHQYEWAVATRLAELARSRQVLVFTHRLSLFGAMEEAAKKLGDEWKKAHLHKHCIESFGGTSGHPANQDISNTNTARANNILITRLDEAKRVGASSGAASYRALAQGICSDLRKLIERTIEEDLLNAVVLRHRRSIQTDHKLDALAYIHNYDCSFFDGLMTKYSCYEHSQSSETPVVIPEEAELRIDIESLKKWREEFKKRPQPEATQN